jgi:hypothetical protein
MLDAQQARASALQIAVQFLGKLPEGSNLDSEETYTDYLLLATRIEKYIRHGGTILEPTESKSAHGSADVNGV